MKHEDGKWEKLYKPTKQWCPRLSPRAWYSHQCTAWTSNEVPYQAKMKCQMTFGDIQRSSSENIDVAYQNSWFYKTSPLNYLKWPLLTSERSTCATIHVVHQYFGFLIFNKSFAPSQVTFGDIWDGQLVQILKPYQKILYFAKCINLTSEGQPV